MRPCPGVGRAACPDAAAYNRMIAHRQPPAVSVVVPSYNHAPFLARRLRSILDQTLDDLEILVLDDASTDESVEVARAFTSDPRVRVVTATHNSGSPFVQWNRGVAATSGTLVWIAESDDDAEARLLETLVSRLEAHPTCGVAFAQSWSIDADGRTHGTLAQWTDTVDQAHWRADYVNDGRDECRRYMAVANTMPSASAVVFRRETYLRAGGAPASMRFAGDWMAWLRMLQVSDVAFVAEPLSRHRTHARTLRAELADDPQRWRETLAVWHHALEAFDLPEETRLRIADIVRDVLVRRLPSTFSEPSLLAELHRLGRRVQPTFTRSLVHLLVDRATARLASR